MTPERWRRIKDVLDRALNRPPGERAALLDRECGGDTALLDVRHETTVEHKVDLMRKIAEGLRCSPCFKNLLRGAIDRAGEQGRHGRDLRPGLERVIRFIDALPGDRAHPDRVDALKALRARLASANRGESR